MRDNVPTEKPTIKNPEPIPPRPPYWKTVYKPAVAVVQRAEWSRPILGINSSVFGLKFGLVGSSSRNRTGMSSRGLKWEMAHRHREMRLLSSHKTTRLTSQGIWTIKAHAIQTKAMFTRAFLQPRHLTIQHTKLTKESKQLLLRAAVNQSLAQRKHPGCSWSQRKTWSLKFIIAWQPGENTV